MFHIHNIFGTTHIVENGKNKKIFKIGSKTDIQDEYILLLVRDVMCNSKYTPVTHNKILPNENTYEKLDEIKQIIDNCKNNNDNCYVEYTIKNRNDNIIGSNYTNDVEYKYFDKDEYFNRQVFNNTNVFSYPFSKTINNYDGRLYNTSLLGLTLFGKVNLLIHNYESGEYLKLSTDPYKNPDNIEITDYKYKKVFINKVFNWFKIKFNKTALI